uniref:Ubiquinone biosynthesis protein n=1 Tax=Araucaria cunninghamii TaxID=56994 RepID=A0A0D6R360_ARACU
MMMNTIRTTAAKVVRRLQWLSISSSLQFNYHHTALPFPRPLPSPSSLPCHQLGLPYSLGVIYNLRAFSDTSAGAGPGAPHESVKPEGTQTEQSQGEESTGEEEKKGYDLRDEQTRVLEAAFGHVAKLGWTEAAMVAGARDLGISPSIVGSFPRKEAALVEYFMDDCLQRLVDEIESRKDELSNMVLNDRIAKLIRIRLEMQAPYISKWPQALSVQAHPLNLPTSFKQRAILVDEIWHAAGDRSTDVDWYAKRTLLGGVYTATELYMLTDYSPQFRETWSFLDNRIRDVLDCRKTAQEAAQLAAAIGAGLSNTLQAFVRRQN